MKHNKPGQTMYVVYVYNADLICNACLISFVLFCVLPSVDPYGFERSDDFDYSSYEELMSQYLVVLTRRSIKWSKLLKGKNRVHKNVKCECQTNMLQVSVQC